VDKLISDLQSGKITYNKEITAKIRPHELTLGNWPCHKYIINGDGSRIDSRKLPTEIVPKGEKPKYRNSVTQDSKLTAKENKADLKKRVKSIHDHADELLAQKTESLTVLLEGDNAAGKDGMIKHVFSLNPQTTAGQRALKAATAEEKQHDSTFRVAKNLADPGTILYQNRTGYGDATFAAKNEAEVAGYLAGLKELEYGRTMGLPMTPEGRIALPDKLGNVDPSSIQKPPTRFLKVLVGSSAAEQAARFADRLTDPKKLYKIGQADLDGHPQHADVLSKFATYMAANSTPWAPTYFIPNDNKVTGWRKMGQIADETLTDMNPQRPDAKIALDPAARKRVAKELMAEVEQAQGKKVKKD
jgi:polyphosphate kinase 2 (PPK2 family)